MRDKQNHGGGSKLAVLMILLICVAVVGFVAYGLLVAYGPRM